jgi:hypothetical protein
MPRQFRFAPPALALILFLAVLPPRSHADGDCTKFRPATAAEQQVYAAMRAAVAKAAPAAPSGWRRSDQLDLQPADAIADCTGRSTTEALQYRFRFAYAFDRDTQAPAFPGMDPGLAQGTPEQQTRQRDLDQRRDALREARKQARRTGDQAALAKAEAQLDQLDQEREALDEQIAQGMMASLQSSLADQAAKSAGPAVKEASLSIRVNANAAWVPDGAERVAIAGAGEAWWRPGTIGSLLILLGPWDPKTHRAQPQRGDEVTRARTVIIEIEGERSAAEKLAAGLDVAAIATQLQ